LVCFEKYSLSECVTRTSRPSSREHLGGFFFAHEQSLLQRDGNLFVCAPLWFRSDSACLSSPKRFRRVYRDPCQSEVQRARVEDLIAALRTHNDGIKWASSVNLHLTLKFLGPTVPIEKIIASNLNWKASPETLRHSNSRPPVWRLPRSQASACLMVGLRSDALLDLAARIDDAASRCGFAREQRAFRGHLTIARLKRPLLHAETRARMEAASKRDFGASTIREMTLYRSITAPAGSIYEALANFSVQIANLAFH